jgi:hypothetical protein
MAGAGRKVFQPGEILRAADVNGFLMDQAVMVFDDATERDLALGTAVVSEGMVSYLADSNQLQFNDGSDWRTVFGGTAVLSIASGGTGGTAVAEAQDNLRVGLVPISPSSVVVAGAGSSASANDLGKVTFSTATSVSLNDVFSEDYQKYLVVWRVNTSASAFIQMRLRVSGSDVSTSSYNTAGLAVRTTAATFTSVSSLGTAFNVSTANSPAQGRASGVLNFDSPFISSQTTIVGHSLGHDTTSVYSLSNAFQHVTAASYTGFSLLAGSGTILGEVQVFGYNE